MLPRCSLSIFMKGYLHSKYTGYQYPCLPPCPVENDDKYQYVLYEYLLACSLLEKSRLDYPHKEQKAFALRSFIPETYFQTLPLVRILTMPVTLILCCLVSQSSGIFDKHVSSVPLIVATKPLTLFLVSLSVT